MSDLEAFAIPTIAACVVVVVAYFARRLGHAEAEAALYRSLHVEWLERHKAATSSSSSMRAKIQPATPPPTVRPAGVPMAEWRRRQGGEEEGDE